MPGEGGRGDRKEREGEWTEGKMGNGNEMMKGTIGALISQNVALKSQERKRSIQHVFAIGLLLALLAFLF